jgi:hypothetical protein
MSAPEDAAVAGEVWQESDGCLLTVIVPGESWAAFQRGPLLDWHAPTIARPLRRLLDPKGRLVLAALPSEPVPNEDREALAQAIGPMRYGNEDREYKRGFNAGLEVARRIVRTHGTGGLS